MGGPSFMSLERQSRSSLLNSTLVTDVTLLILLLVDMVEFSLMSICHSFDLGRSPIQLLGSTLRGKCPELPDELPFFDLVRRWEVGQTGRIAEVDECPTAT